MHSQKLQARFRRKARIRARMMGSAERPRLVIFRSNVHMSAQLIDDHAGKTLASAHDFKEKKGTKTKRAEKVGKLIAEEALKKNINTCVFDRAGYQYHGRVKALAEAAREAGLKF